MAPRTTPVRVSHVITGLGAGGAENMLLKVLTAGDRSRCVSEVISLTGDRPIGLRLRDAGVTVHALDMPPGLVTPRGLHRLGALLRRRRPDVIQTWMYHADLLGGLLGRATTDASVAWGLRGSVDEEQSKWHSRAVARTCGALSAHVPATIVSCSEELARLHVDRLGFAAGKIRVIPNGFDLDRFRPDPEAGPAVRRELGVPAEAPLVGLIARWDPQKDHATFFAAAARVRDAVPAARFVLCGSDIDDANGELTALVAQHGLSERTHLLGRRDDLPRLTAALTVAVSSSAFGEGFSNVLGEAMASGVPCVATRVGDAELILGETGRIVAPRDAGSLASAIVDLLERVPAEREAVGLAARRRVQERFEIGRVTRAFEDLWVELAA